MFAKLTALTLFASTMVTTATPAESTEKGLFPDIHDAALFASDGKGKGKGQSTADQLKKEFTKKGYASAKVTGVKSLDEAVVRLTVTMGPPQESFPNESVWYKTNPISAKNHTKIVTVQLLGGPGKPELRLDGRTTEARGGPLQTGPETRHSFKSPEAKAREEARRAQQARGNEAAPPPPPPPVASGPDF